MRAVLLPLTCYSRVMETGEAKLRAGNQILHRWHEVIEKLAQHDGYASETLRVKMLHCPPAGFEAVSLGFQPRTCQLRRLCPFCWGRQATVTWSLVDKALFPLPTGGEGRATRSTCDLVLVTRAIPLPDTYEDPGGPLED